MSAHELLEEPPQGHVRSELAGGTYNEMIKARPAGVPALLRSLHKQKSPQRQVLAIELMTVIQNDVIRDNAIPSQWNALLEAGLHHLYVEILMTDEIYHTTIEVRSDRFSLRAGHAQTYPATVATQLLDRYRLGSPWHACSGGSRQRGHHSLEPEDRR